MGYHPGSAATIDDLLQAIQTAAVAAGWTADRAGSLGAGGAAGYELLVHKGDNYVQLRSFADCQSYLGYAKYAGPSLFIKGGTGFDNGQSWEEQPGAWATSRERAMYIGTTQLTTALADVHVPQWPVPYRIFTFTDPDMVLCIARTGATQYQWIMFGQIEKFGTWTGGTFIGATNSEKQATSTNGSFANLPIFSVGGSSRTRSYAPFHNMETSFNRSLTADNVTNSCLLMDVLGEGSTWTTNGPENPFNTSEFFRRGYANALTNPINNRSPNTFNQVGVMTPLWIYTQRDAEPNYAVVGRLPHVRQIPLQNFDPEDIFELGADRWIVFPYFERGGTTGLWGWAIDANEVP